MMGREVLMSKPDDFPYVDTRATRMLAEALQRTMAEDGLSLRQLGKELGYKQAVVLSHMASGRVPIPVDRSASLARSLNIDPQAFLTAVLEQRHPDVDWTLLAPGESEDVHRFSMMADLTGGRAYDELTPGQRKVMREAAADNRAERRWLTPHEVSAIELLRTLRPAMVEHGLDQRDREMLRSTLTGRRAV
ncbi:hypothetical protein AVM11_11530 [Sphingomonas melonis TY]|uniref:Uncharacterized protein n=2 Tax=Sphingomonas melonis TaxID=152682 RepID=A0A175XZI1_9SPHN|nr:hypothetical protein BJP26_04045 [Sphingomonas melonis TY]KZB93761.1 hypothetical protein AVM11_11530 [Sphingomonas melonis TY]